MSRCASWIAWPVAIAALALPDVAGSATGAYERCDPLPGTQLTLVANTTCDAAATGTWTPVRAATAPGGRAYDLVAVRQGAVLRVRRAGATPDLDGPAAGRELVFAAGPIVGGRPIPRGAAFCTSGFLIRLSGGRRGVLSAAHCAGLRRDGHADLRNAALRRRPQPGVVLGRVLRMLIRSRPLDALVLPVPRGPHRTAPAVVDRGITRPPWIVAGTARPLAGRRVCFSGRTSGIDRCGILRGARRATFLVSLQSGRIVQCTTIRARPGDSGGPVYTAPRADGTVRAVGLVTLGVGSSGVMCFTPLAPVLHALHATLVRG